MKIYRINPLFVEISNFDADEPPDGEQTFATWREAYIALLTQLTRRERYAALRLAAAKRLRPPLDMKPSSEPPPSPSAPPPLLA